MSVRKTLLFSTVFVSLLLIPCLVYTMIDWFAWEPLPSDVRADGILVQKSERRLTLLWKGKTVRTYQFTLRDDEGPKCCEGDLKTPEGRYSGEWKPDTAYYKAYRIDYPAENDVECARRKGCSPGGNIEIHGFSGRFPKWLEWAGSLQRFVNLGRGCIMVTNREIDEIYLAVGGRDHIPVEVTP